MEVHIGARIIHYTTLKGKVGGPPISIFVILGNSRQFQRNREEMSNNVHVAALVWRAGGNERNAPLLFCLYDGFPEICVALS